MNRCDTTMQTDCCVTSSNAAALLLARNMERHPDKAAYICEDRAISYRQLDQAARNFAGLLRQSGIKPGERAVIVLPDTFAFPTAFLGSLLAGVTAVAVSTVLRRVDYQHILQDSGARLLISAPEMTLPLEAAAGNVELLLCDEQNLFETAAPAQVEQPVWQPTDKAFAFMMYSSGSTGKPKGIPHRHSDLLLPCTLVGENIFGITHNDTIFSVSKFSFAYGLINSLVFPLYFGATAVIHPGKPDPGAILELIQQHQPSVFFSVPTVYTQLILSCSSEKLQLPMRLCISAGEALPPSVFEEWQRLTGLELVDGIGSTEMLYIFICNQPGRVISGSAGQLVPGYQARLVDEYGNNVAAGTPGDLLVAGETSTQFYWNLPDKSAETMLADGFIRTGDVFVEKDGYYYHHGRSDDMIKSGGQWVSPVPVEEALLKHPAVAECAVASIKAGSLFKPGAFIILAPGFQQDRDLLKELRSHMQQLLPEYMCPARYSFVSELPRTATGKIQRFMLREQ